MLNSNDLTSGNDTIAEDRPVKKGTKNRIVKAECQEFATRLIEAMDKVGISQTALAKSLGLSRSAVNFWCQGDTYPSIPHAAEVAAFLRTTPEYLLYGAVKVPKERLSESIPVMAKIDDKETVITRMAMPKEFLAHAGLLDISKLKAMVITEEKPSKGFSRGDIIIADVTDKEVTTKPRSMVVENGGKTSVGMVRLSRRPEHIRITMGYDKPFDMPLSGGLIVGKLAAQLTATAVDAV